MIGRDRQVIDERHSSRPSTRERIIEGARSVLKGQSLKATTVQDILDRADVSRRTFYLQFRNLEALLLALYTESTDGLVQSIRIAIEAAKQPLQKIEAALDAYLKYQQRGGPALAALDVEAMRRDSTLAARREETLDALVDLIDGAVTEDIGVQIDPLVYRGLVLGMEGMVASRQSEGGFSDQELKRVRAVAVPMFLQVLSAARTLPRKPAQRGKTKD
jgi:AcrR family transcriptional regulator